MKSGAAINDLSDFTLSYVWEQAARLERKDVDKTKSCPLVNTDIQGEVLDQLPWPQTQTELVAAESAR